jgi:hypothetical protein
MEDLGQVSEASTGDLPGDISNLTAKSTADGLYPFHLSNIHERCFSAYLARSLPMVIFVLTLLVTGIGLFVYPYILLAVAAFFNTWMWLWLVSYALSTIRATREAQRTVAAAEKQEDTELLMPVSDDAELGESRTDVLHLIVLPNYKEDELILAATLEGLAQAVGSKDFRVVLAMEEREGQDKVHKKAVKLQDRFGPCFADLCATLHPLNLEELHLDGSVNAEIPGKSSNLKWAVNVGRERCMEDGVDPGSTVLTVADADCIFHPSYFDKVGSEFRELRAASAATSGSGTWHPWTIWQPPQLPFRNYYGCMAPARVWGYIATIYEFGGVGGLVHAGFHMTFSSFSLPLELVSEADPWDGDVIADDHHCYLKCFFV